MRFLSWFWPGIHDLQGNWISIIECYDGAWDESSSLNALKCGLTTAYLLPRII